MDDILITGATGFVGRHLVPRLLQDGHSVVLAVRSVEACPMGWRDDNRIRIVVTGPIETASNLDVALAGVSTVVHLAGLAHVPRSQRSEDRFILANATATERLVAAASDKGVGTFIHMSSLAVVTPNASPTVVDDSSDEGAVTPYGRSKRIAERHVLELAKTGTLAVSLRPPLVVGADARGNWALLQRLAATGLPLPFAGVDNRRSRIGVETLAQAVAHLSAKRWPTEKSGNYCIADAEPMPLPQIVALLRQGMGLAPRLFPFPPGILFGLARLVGRGQMAAGLLGNLVVDASRFRQTFNFSQEKSLTDSIRDSGADYRRRAA